MAVGIYRRILELEPGSAKAYLRICQTYAEVGEFLAATPFCETATELDENYADAWQWLGQMRYTRRNYEGTLEAMEKCVALGSNGRRMLLHARLVLLCARPVPARLGRAARSAALHA